MEKAGLIPHHVVENAARPLLGDTATEYVTRLTRAEWERGRAQDPVDAATRSAQQAERARIEHGNAAHRVHPLRRADGIGPGSARRGAGGRRRHLRLVPGRRPRRGHDAAPGLLGPYPELAETPSAGYMQRTAWNVRDSHATLVVSPDGVEPASGTSATGRPFARAYGRPVFVADRVDDLPAIRAWLAEVGRDLTLNVAGPAREQGPHGLRHDARHRAAAAGGRVAPAPAAGATVAGAAAVLAKATVTHSFSSGRKKRATVTHSFFDGEWIHAGYA